MTAIEILPVCLKRGRLGLLRPPGQDSWLIDWQDGLEPGAQVRGELARRGLEPVVLHSTSWRTAASGLVLTFVAALESPAIATGFTLSYLSPGPIARGSATQPPQSVSVQEVTRHALRHLAWLNRHDESVRRALPPAWAKALAVFGTEPFLSTSTFAVRPAGSSSTEASSTC